MLSDSDELAHTLRQDPVDDEWTKTTLGEPAIVTSEIACRVWINISSQGRLTQNWSSGLFEDLIPSSILILDPNRFY
jgi:hypothetical protein